VLLGSVPIEVSDSRSLEGVWSHMKKALVNLAVRTTDQLGAIVKTPLIRMRYRPRLIPRFVAKTSLNLQPP
jgi:hypothetical protein